MRLLLYFIVLTLITGCASFRSNPEGLKYPLAITPLEGHPLVEAWVSGKQVRLAVDTGASQDTLLFSSAVELMGGKIQGKGDIKTTDLDAYVYEGQDHETRQAVAEAPLTHFFGLVGWPLIQRFVWQINYPEEYHQFTDSVPFMVRNSYTSMKLTTKNGFPHINNNSGFSTVIDTGAPYAIYLSKNLWQKWKQEHPYTFITVYDGHSPAAGGAYSRECARAKSFTINGITFHDIIIAESFVDKNIMKLDRDIDIMIGQEAFKAYDVWMDPAKEKIYFSKKRKANSDPISLNLVGISFLPREEGKLKYECVVLKDSIAWDVGLRTGDLLVSINGRKSPDQDLITYLTQTPGTTVYITVWRKGSTKSTRWFIPSEEELQPKPPAPEPSDLQPEEGSPIDQETGQTPVNAVSPPASIPVSSTPDNPDFHIFQI